MKSRGYTLLDMVILMGVCGIATLLFVTKTSYAFSDHTKDYYDNIIDLALKQAELYGESSEVLKENKVEIITINDLVDKKYMGANASGDVVDPRNNEKNLNSVKIKLKIDENSDIIASIEK